MKEILIVSATPFEIAGLVAYLDSGFELKSGVYKNDYLSVTILVSGLGMVNTTYALTGLLSSVDPYNLAINAGLCGSFDRDTPLGTVVNINKDTFGDLGVTEQDGSFVSAFDLRFISGDEHPYTDGWIVNKNGGGDFLPNKSSVTVNNVSGSIQGIAMLKQKYTPDMESMEGASFAFVCEKFEQNYLQIRAVSNFIEPRNRSNWNVELALDNLNEVLIGMLQALSER